MNTEKPKDYEESYCSFPDILLENTYVFPVLQQKYGKINGPCYWHDEDSNEDMFLSKLNREVDGMHKEEMQYILKSLNKDLVNAVRLHEEKKETFLYKLISKFISFNKSK